MKLHISKPANAVQEKDTLLFPINPLSTGFDVDFASFNQSAHKDAEVCLDMVSMFCNSDCQQTLDVSESGFKNLTHKFVEIDLASERSGEDFGHINLLAPHPAALDASSLALMTSCKRLFRSETDFIHSAPNLTIDSLPPHKQRPIFDTWASYAGREAALYLTSFYQDDPLGALALADISSIVAESVSNSSHSESLPMEFDRRHEHGQNWSCSVVARKDLDCREISISILTGGMTMGASMLRYLHEKKWKSLDKPTHLDNTDDSKNSEKMATYCAVSGRLTPEGKIIGNGLSKTRSALNSLGQEAGTFVKAVVVSGRCMSNLMDTEELPADIRRLPPAYSLRGALISVNITIRNA